MYSGAASLKSPFKDKLGTNYLASSAEAPSIRQIIRDSLEERSRITDRLSRFYVLIDDLHLQLESIDKHVHKHRALLCAFHTLPVELIQRIFKFCVYLLPGNPSFTTTEAPLVFGHVCKLWRNISFSTPCLWTSIHLPMPPMGVWENIGELTASYNEATVAWLTRSANLPLSISVAGGIHGYPNPDQPQKAHVQLLDTLLRFSHRWSHVNFKLKMEDLDYLTSLSECDVPMLKTVELEIASSLEDTSIMTRLSFLHAPSIHRLFLWNSTIQRPHLDLPIRWEMLTTFSSCDRPHQSDASLTLQQAIDVLRNCSNILVCSLVVSSDEGPLVSTDYQPLDLLQLRELRVDLGRSQLPDNTFDKFCQNINAPRLRHLELTKGRLHTRIAIGPILARPHELDTVALDIEGHPAEELLNHVRTLPDLKRLYLDSSSTFPPGGWYPGGSDTVTPCLNATFLSGITVKPSTSDGVTLCPYLSEIHLLFPSNTDVTDDNVLQFILSRTRLAPAGVTKLKYARFKFLRPMQRDIYADLQTVIEEGPRFEISYITPPLTNTYSMFNPREFIEITQHHDDWVPRSLENYYAWGSPW